MRNHCLQLIIILVTTFLLSSCTENKKTTKAFSDIIPVEDINPAAEGFNATDSDPKAIELADKVMLAMGGRAAYDQARYLSWNFFGSRKHVWDKHTGEVYIKNLREDYELYMNINDMEGRMVVAGLDIVNLDTLAVYLEKGKSMWINDAYWLVMPYKLKDSGVTLKYLGESKTEKGTASEKLELTFSEVGKTPNNKYHIHIDKYNYLVSQWDFFTNATDTIPRFSSPWEGYQDYGGIILSGGRGKNSLTEIEVSEGLKRYFE